MKNQCFKFITISVSLSLFVFLNAQQIQAQEKQEYLNFNDILTRLTFISRISSSTQEINQQLIKDIQKRKVNFILSSENETSLKKAGASDLLIKTIRESLSKEKQDLINEQQALYKKFTDNYASKNPKQVKIAIEAGKEFVKRYKNDKDVKVIIDYLEENIPKLEERINCCWHPPNPKYKNYEKFDTSIKEKKWDDLFEVGAEILKTEPELIDVTLVLAYVGFDILTKESNRKYLDQTLYYAEKSIQLLEKSKFSITGDYGVLQYSYKNKEFPDGKANALGYMNYIIGYIKYFYLNQKDEAFPYFQKSLQYKSAANELVRKLNLPEGTFIN